MKGRVGALVPDVEVHVLDVPSYYVYRFPTAGTHDLGQTQAVDRQLLCGTHS